MDKKSEWSLVQTQWTQIYGCIRLICLLIYYKAYCDEPYTYHFRKESWKVLVKGVNDSSGIGRQGIYRANRERMVSPILPFHCSWLSVTTKTSSVPPVEDFFELLLEQDVAVINDRKTIITVNNFFMALLIYYFGFSIFDQPRSCSNANCSTFDFIYRNSIELLGNIPKCIPFLHCVISILYLFVYLRRSWIILCRRRMNQ